MNPVNKKHIACKIHEKLENVGLKIGAIFAKSNMISSHLGHEPLLIIIFRLTHFFRS